jgi:capsular exopolysaccharide synthesis family protein
LVAEEFRSLRGRIDAIAAEKPLRSIVVVSAKPGEGKTTAAINLAAVTALSLDTRVVLVDCDLRRPRVHQVLGLRPEAGLSEVLTGQASLDLAITKVDGANFDVVAVRAKPPNPSELLGSARMREVIEELSRDYDRVIVDSPAALDLPDAKAISEICDGLIMVVRADVTAGRDLAAALELLDHRRILGMLLNGARLEQGRFSYAT